MARAQRETPPVRLDVRMVPTASLQANPWNPNAMTERELAATVESIEDYTFVDPITVRVRPRGRFQVLDGFHRWQAAKRAGVSEVMVQVLDVPDDLQAKRLTLVLNTRGEPDRVDLSRLLAEIAAELGDTTSRALAYEPDELASLISSAEANWRDNPQPAKKLPPLAPGAPGDVTIYFVVPSGSSPVVERALAEVKGLPEDDRAGRLTVLCQSYLDTEAHDD